MFRHLIGSSVAAQLVPPSLKQTYGNKHTSLATTGYIWVTNTGTQKVEKINTTTLEVTEYTSGGGYPVGITFDGTYLYISHFASNNIVKMTTTGTIIDIFPVGIGLHQIAFDGTDLWVTSYWEGKIYKLSTTGTILATYTSGRYPVDIMVAGGKVWVSLFNFTTESAGTGALLKLNLDGTLDAEYVVGDHPLGLAYTGTNVLVTDFLNGNYYEVNPTTGAILNTYNSGIANSTNLDIAYSSYDDCVFLTVSKDYSAYDLPNNYNKVQVRRATGGTLVEEVQVGIDPRNVSFDSNNYGYVAGYGDGSVTRFLLPNPPPSIYFPFSTYPFTNQGTTPVDSTGGAISSSHPLFGTSSLINTGVHLYISPTAGDNFIHLPADFTFRWSEYSEVLDNAYGTFASLFGAMYRTTAGYTIPILGNLAFTNTTGSYYRFSYERYNGVLYFYVNGTLLHSTAYAGEFANQLMVTGVETTAIHYIDELALWVGTSLARGASSYTVESVPFM